MAKKTAEKTAARRYPAVLRVTNEVRDMAKSAASSKGMSVAAYTCDILTSQASIDLKKKWAR